jgi:hypothetical protein
LAIRINKPPHLRIVVPTLEIVQPSLGIVEVASVAEWVDGSHICCHASGGGYHVAPGVVIVLYHLFPGFGDDGYYVSLSVLDIVVFLSVYRQGSGILIPRIKIP